MRSLLGESYFWPALVEGESANSSTNTEAWEGEMRKQGNLQACTRADFPSKIQLATF